MTKFKAYKRTKEKQYTTLEVPVVSDLTTKELSAKAESVKDTSTISDNVPVFRRLNLFESEDYRNTRNHSLYSSS